MYIAPLRRRNITELKIYKSNSDQISFNIKLTLNPNSEQKISIKLSVAAKLAYYYYPTISLRTILAPCSRPRRLGLGGHLPSPSTTPGQPGPRCPTLGLPPYLFRATPQHCSCRAPYHPLDRRLHLPLHAPPPNHQRTISPQRGDTAGVLGHPAPVPSGGPHLVGIPPSTPLFGSLLVGIHRRQLESCQTTPSPCCIRVTRLPFKRVSSSYTISALAAGYSRTASVQLRRFRKWTPGHSFQEAGASLVSSCRAYLSHSISLKWVKGHPERSETPHSSWSRQQWGIYIADALSKNRDLGSLPHSPIPTIRLHHLSLPDVLRVTPPTLWQWIGPDSTPPLGNLRSMLSHHRVLAYRTNRDSYREDRGAPSIWVTSHQTVGPASWLRRSLPLRQRVRALRSLWDLRWHGENRAVAARTVDPQVSACPICHRHWDQSHVLCECPSSTGARAAGSLDITIAISHLSPGPMLELGRKFQLLSPSPINPP